MTYICILKLMSFPTTVTPEALPTYTAGSTPTLSPANLLKGESSLHSHTTHTFIFCKLCYVWERFIDGSLVGKGLANHWRNILSKEIFIIGEVLNKDSLNWFVLVSSLLMIKDIKIVIWDIWNSSTLTFKWSY